jgi:hypothetical protein
MGRAEKLWGVIDPAKTSPEVFEMLCDMPGDRVANLLAACECFKDDFSRAIVLKTAQDEAFTRDGRNLAEIASILHLAAVMAPVVAPFAYDPVIANEDGSVSHLVVANVYRCKNNLEMYWQDDVQDFHLTEKNRAYFVRGWTLLTFMGIGEVIMDAELDQHLIWVGSRWDDLRANARAIIESGKFDKGSLNEFADKSFDAEDTTLPDGSPNQQWYADNRDRLMGYAKGGHYSIFPDSITEHLLKQYKDVSVTICGVPIRVEEFIYLEARADGALDQSTHMQLLGILSEGISMEAPFGGKAALLLSTFSDASLHAFGHVVENYSLPVRNMILKVLLDHAALRKPVNAPFEDERFIGTVISIAPVFHAFFEAKYSPNEPEQPEEWGSFEWATEMQERHDDALWTAIHDCYDHLLNVDLDEAAMSDFNLMVMFLRAMTLAHFVDVETDGPDERIVIDVGMINENIDSICENASLLMRAQSLSFETIAKLPRN